MQHRILGFLLLLFTGIGSAFCQVDDTRNYVYFFSDSVLYGRNVELSSSFTRGTYLLCDTIKIHPDQVKFFRGETGFFANTIRLKYSGTSSFCERIRKGRINLYEKDVTTQSPGTYINGRYSPGMSGRTINNFYNKGFGDLKKANYNNLVTDLSDNPESMMYLDKYKKSDTKQKIFQIAGGTLIVGGLVALISAKNKPVISPNYTPGAILMGTGAASMWVGYFVYLSKPKHLKNAIDVYNTSH